MRKLMGIGMPLLISLSICSCSSNTSYLKDKNFSNQRITSNNFGTSYNINKSYKDGTYTALGNEASGNNQKATVTISGGKITAISLDTITTNNTSNTEDKTGTIKRLGYNNGISGNYVNSNSLVYNKAHTIVRGTRGISGTAASIAAKNNLSFAGNTTSSTLDLTELKSNLTSAMIKNQTPNVNIQINNNKFLNTINNWKLAVSRALDKASL